MSFENDILRLLLLENYMSSAKSDPNSESKVKLEIKSRDCTSVRFGDRTYRTRKFGDKVWMIDNLDLPLRYLGIVADDNTRSENGIKYYTWKNAMEVASHFPGWHLPSVEEWRELSERRTRIGLASFESEFNLFPTGYIDSDSILFGSNQFACFWTSDEIVDTANGVFFDQKDGEFATCGYTRSTGRCIRLVKDD